MRDDGSFIASSGARVYFPATMLRLICAFFIACAMFLSPVAMATGGGMAMAHAATVADAGAHGHCEEGGAPAGKKKPDMKMSCASACAAFLAVVPAVAEQGAQPKSAVAIASSAFLLGVAPERETPPPRSAPAI